MIIIVLVLFSTLTPTNAGTIGGGTTFSLILSDGTTQQVWDVLSTGLKLMTYMNSKNMYYLAANDDITVINCGAKLLVLENTFLNQKLMNTYTFTYHAGKVVGIHRNLSNMVNLTDALVSVGYTKLSATAFANNYDLEGNLADAERPRIKVFDYYYETTPANSSTGSLLENTTPIAIDLVP